MINTINSDCDNSDPSVSEPGECLLTDVLFGHAAFQYLNAGCQLGLFELLHERVELTYQDLLKHLKLPERSLTMALFGLMALKFIKQTNTGFCNTEKIEAHFRNGTWELMRNTTLFQAEIVYTGQADFVASLRSGKNIGLRRIPGEARDLYHRLEANPELSRVFFDYMGAWSNYSNVLMMKTIDFARVRSLLDIGGGDGTNAIAIAERWQDIAVTAVDLPEAVQRMEMRFEKSIARQRLRALPLEILQEPFPGGHDCILFAHELVIWDLNVVEALLRKAYKALPVDGSVIVFNSMANDDWSGPKMAALDSVYFMCIPAEGGTIHRWIDYESALQRASFVDIQRVSITTDATGLCTPHGVILAYKR